MNEVDRLVEGLQILKRYEPDLVPCSTHRARRVLETQEDGFAAIAEEDRARLANLGWLQAGTYLWVF
jgi:hypothetical protein